MSVNLKHFSTQTSNQSIRKLPGNPETLWSPSDSDKPRSRQAGRQAGRHAGISNSIGTWHLWPKLPSECLYRNSEGFLARGNGLPALRFLAQ